MGTPRQDRPVAPRPLRNQRDWYTLEEASKLLQAQESTVVRQLDDHNVSYTRSRSGRYKINKDALMRYLHGAGVDYQ